MEDIVNTTQAITETTQMQTPELHITSSARNTSLDNMTTISHKPNTNGELLDDKQFRLNGTTESFTEITTDLLEDVQDANELTSNSTTVSPSKTTNTSLIPVNDTTVSVTSTLQTLITSTHTNSTETTSSAINTTTTMRTTLTSTRHAPTTTNLNNDSTSATQTEHATTSLAQQTTKATSTQKLVTDTMSRTGANSASGDSAFGRLGLPLLAASLVIIVVLVVIIIIIIARRCRRDRHHANREDQSTPKLQLLEIKDADNMRKTALHEDLHTYSLDYDRHVQEKIEEHKRQTKPPIGSKPAVGGTTTFKLTKKASLISGVSVSSSTSGSPPMSPMSPEVQQFQPLLSPDAVLAENEEPVVFNVAKRPSECLTNRRASNLDSSEKGAYSGVNKYLGDS